MGELRVAQRVAAVRARLGIKPAGPCSGPGGPAAVRNSGTEKPSNFNAWSGWSAWAGYFGPNRYTRDTSGDDFHTDLESTRTTRTTRTKPANTRVFEPRSP